MLKKAFADEFAHNWINAWNLGDLNSILSHYTDDFVMSSPLIGTVTGTTNCLSGKAAVCAYWAKAIERMPELHMELIDVLLGIDTIILYYLGPLGNSAEIFFFNDAGKVIKAAAHYQQLPV